MCLVRGEKFRLPSVDDLKLKRDGHLWWGRSDQPRWPYLRPLYTNIIKLPNGNALTEYPDGSAIEWEYVA